VTSTSAPPGSVLPATVTANAAGQNTCTGTQSAEKVLPRALSVTAPGANPNLPPRCGINVMLMLDKSASISTAGQTENVRNATRAFLNALSGTGASVSITDFHPGSSANLVGATAANAAVVAARADTRVVAPRAPRVTG
jgi:hypothetical protein